ncbi:MAG TPA: MFS transporter, partial [Phycisphaerales bacterium]|nr:MFS transporter [Phycisphaerales bacterium]
MRIDTSKTSPCSCRGGEVRGVDAVEPIELEDEGTCVAPVHPFQISLFRMLWLATLVSNVGTWMQEVANSWLMTSLAPDPLMVSLVQVATALPMFLLGLPAGALADLVDKRRWLLGTQTWMMMAAAAMAIVTLTGQMTPGMLLLGSFLLSVGAALNSPGWHSVTPEIVPKETLKQAVTLNGVVINCARALGPAIGGFIVVKAGPGAAFTLNAISFLAVVFVLFSWNRDNQRDSLPSERFLSAMRVGVQHVKHSPLMRLVVLRAGILVFITSVAWSLLPLLCKQEYGFGPRGYSL